MNNLNIAFSSSKTGDSGNWSTSWDDTTTHREFKISASQAESPDDLILKVGSYPKIIEVQLVAPNFNDIEQAHPRQTFYQGLEMEHHDAQYGPQWMFSPPPLVMPLRTERGWLGIALGAPAGQNQFSGWSYRPAAQTDDDFELVIHYDGHEVPAGHSPSVFFLTEAKTNYREVIEWYVELLRSKGWVPSPKREIAKWWHEPMLCTWGEQCNQGYAKGCNNPSSLEINMYETQANQLRWLDHLESKGIPVGLVSMSDKWQLKRERLTPDLLKYPDLRGFADEIHGRGKKVIAWFGVWELDQAPDDWCLRTTSGAKLKLDPESPGYSEQLVEDVKELISPSGYDIDGFFIDFTAQGPMRSGVVGSGKRWGIELLHHYVKLIHDAAKSVKPDAMMMTHCCHPLFADVTDVLRLNDYCFKKPNVVEQARFRHAVAAATSDWLINTDNWFMHSIDEWRRYLPVQPELGIPASWFAVGVHGDATKEYKAFTEEDYKNWKKIWSKYRAVKGL
ncbi:hypothetical protein [Rubellicoccus peritrichatus]|uniref:Uncharacterized protein n=1 Tax=Rubellicoccus peritrichatus TaxID=3080537 RepID=A0AAQ3LCJ0_9BACT|nr:hypothetical protein [Puniceicoccus sp. CR14]WOO43190.1 hypothetical protein RZN69_08795 [Puniceicoccus sp. CR14]